MDQAADSLRRRLAPTRSHAPWCRAAIGSLALVLAPWAAAAPAGLPGDPPSHPEPKARVASAPADTVGGRRALDGLPAPRASAPADPAAQARRLLAQSKAHFQTVQDYTCTFYKRERMAGRLSEPNAMVMKARAHPQSVYFKFIQPNAGREAIWVAGKNNGKIVAHEAGISKVIAGTMHLDPKGGMALEENRHPITEAGIGHMIDKVLARWESDLAHPGAHVVIHPQARVGDRPCTMVEEIHARKESPLQFHKVRIYIDRELGLPIRYEGFDWPARAGAEPELVEEYTFVNLRLNPGLKDRDFDPKNAQYSFGRF